MLREDWSPEAAWSTESPDEREGSTIDVRHRLDERQLHRSQLLGNVDDWLDQNQSTTVSYGTRNDTEARKVESAELRPAEAFSTIEFMMRRRGVDLVDYSNDEYRERVRNLLSHVFFDAVNLESEHLGPQDMLQGEGPSVPARALVSRMRELLIQADIAQQFRILMSRWKSETMAMSSSTDICNHEAYRGIVALGERAIPPVLKELEAGELRLLSVLREIKGDVVFDNVDSVETLASAWLRWGRELGYLD